MAHRRKGLVGALRRAYTASRLQDRLPMHVKLALRRRWVRVARLVGYPVSSPRLPRPSLQRGRRRMRVTHVVVACDLNPRYLDFWPLLKRAWPAIADVEPVLVLIAERDAVPPALASDDQVRLFEPVAGMHTAFQAQCIRLLYPGLLETDGAVLISDMELAPLNPAYFHGPVEKLDDRFFVAYRDVLTDRREVAIPYNAARPEVWAEIFHVDGEDAVRERLARWWSTVDYDGQRGGAGWYTDQLELYRELMPWGESTHRLWMLDDVYTSYRRLNRPVLEREGGLTAGRRREILARTYTDYNAVIPHRDEWAGVNDLVVDLGIESLQRRRPGAALTRYRAPRDLEAYR